MLLFFGCIKPKDSIVVQIKEAKREVALHHKRLHKETVRRAKIHRHLEMKKNGETKWGNNKKAAKAYIAKVIPLPIFASWSAERKIGVEYGDEGVGGVASPNARGRRGSLDIRTGQLEAYANEGELGSNAEQKRTEKAERKAALKAKKAAEKEKRDADKAKKEDEAIAARAAREGAKKKAMMEKKDAKQMAKINAGEERREADGSTENAVVADPVEVIGID
jgi:hypothetical protein